MTWFVVALLAAAGPLTPDDAVALALSRSDDVRRAELAVELVRVEGTALRLEAPELQLGHRALGGNNGDQVDPFDDTQLGLAWAPPVLEDLGTTQGIGQLRAEAAFEDVDDVRAVVAQEVRMLHAQILSLRDELALARERVQLLERVAALQAQRVSEAVATALDARLTALDRLDAQADVADLGSSLARAEQRLGRLLGEPVPLGLAAPATPLCGLPADTLDDALRQTTERSPQLRAIALREEALALRERRTWLRYVPWLDRLQAGTIFQGGVAELRARIDITLPLFEPLRPDLRLAELERERLAADRRAVQRDLEEKLRAAFERLDGYVKLTAVYAAASADVEESQATVARSLAAEVTDTLRVASVQERVLNAKRQALRARLRCDEASIAYVAAAGLLLP